MDITQAGGVKYCLPNNAILCYECVSLSAHELQTDERQRDLAVESNLRDIGARSKRNGTCTYYARSGLQRPSPALFKRLLLLAIASLLVACGGGNSGPGPGGGGGGAVVCTTGPAPAVLTWDTVSDPDLLGYRIYYGTAPGMYFQPRGGRDPVNVTTYTVMGLTSGTTYYFATTAYGTTQFESAFSNEVCNTIS
jgi:hypothetical protein